MIAGLVAGPTAPASAAASAMSLTVTSNPDSVSTGQAMAYTITAANTGGSAASGATITDTITSLGTGGVATTPLMNTNVGSCSYDATTSQVTCTAASLAAGQAWTVSITGQMTAAAGTVAVRHRHRDGHRVVLAVQRVGHDEHDGEPEPCCRPDSPKPSWRTA